MLVAVVIVVLLLTPAIMMVPAAGMLLGVRLLIVIHILLMRSIRAIEIRLRIAIGTFLMTVVWPVESLRPVVVHLIGRGVVIVARRRESRTFSARMSRGRVHAHVICRSRPRRHYSVS